MAKLSQERLWPSHEKRLINILLPMKPNNLFVIYIFYCIYILLAWSKPLLTLFSHSLRIEELWAILIWPLNCDQFIRIAPLYISLTVGGVCALTASCVNSTMQFLSVAAAMRNLTRLLCCRGNELIYNQIWSIFGPAMTHFAHICCGAIAIWM